MKSANKPLKVMVVDDHHDGAEALGLVLSVLGADVLISFSGEEAVEVAKDFRPRLVVLDINMPGLDGFETADQLKQQEWAADSTFVAHTAFDRAREAAAVAGFDHFVVKGDNSVVTFRRYWTKSILESSTMPLHRAASRIVAIASPSSSALVDRGLMRGTALPRASRRRR